MVAERSFAELRREMVERQVAARGIRSPRVLEAMQRVPRERFVEAALQEFAYEDSPLPIEEDQTISQPYIVAYMVDALELDGRERVLEVGTGSGYAAVVLAELAGEVYTIERHATLAIKAQGLFAELGYGRTIHVRHGDGTQGWAEASPFEAILVSAGGPAVPPALRDQLADGGRLVIPVGDAARGQRLVRITRTGPDSFEEDDLGAVRFVPLIGQHGWEEPAAPVHVRTKPRQLPGLIADCAEPILSVDNAGVHPLLERIGDARLVLIGEASHGTSEFYRLRQHVTQALIEEKGFNIVAIEADWPDAARIDQYVRHRDVPPSGWQAFARFPTWMWRNQEVRAFVDWLHVRNAEIARPDRRAAIYGLDLYSLSTSITAVLDFLDRIDPATAAIARERYGCLTPWQADPATYGRMARSARYQGCADQVVKMLNDLLAKRLEYLRHDGEHLLDAIQNARLIANAEEYYRALYLEPHESWNLRDSHMFETLRMLLTSDLAPGAKAVVWAHNSHLGDARATEMAARGEHNLGQLCRETFGDEAYLIGFGTHSGTVAAASHWGGPMEVKAVRPSHTDSYERLCHDSDVEAFFLPLRHAARAALRDELTAPRLERAIGVIYRPDTELASHYFDAVLPEQFDEYVWLDTTQAVRPLAVADLGGLPRTYPFGV